MTREQDFERRLGDWMSDGPFEAPRRPVAAAVAYVQAHPRKRTVSGRPGVSMHPNLLPIPLPRQRRSWLVAAATLAVVALVAGAFLLAPRGQVAGPASPSSTSSSGIAPMPSASPAPSASASTSPLPSSVSIDVPITEPVHVSGWFGSLGDGASYNLSCGTPCQVGSSLRSSNDRLSGCYVFVPGQVGADAAYGSIEFWGADWNCPYATRGKPELRTWAGEWFSSRSRSAPLGDSSYEPGKAYPLDSVWLRGLGANAGLTAILSIAAPGEIDGWIFPTPERGVSSLVTTSSAGPSPNPTTAQASPAITGPVHLSSAASDGGNPCARYYFCLSTADVSATEPRLSGAYVLEPSGSSAQATWGIVSFLDRPTSSAYHLPADGSTVTWWGEWLASGSRPIYQIDDEPARDLNYLYPVDKVWLTGQGPNAGLVAVLNISAPGKIDGWIFPSPPAS